MAQEVKAKGRRTSSMSDINITPLIDVMLVLLIIFMVVTPIAQKGMDVSLPHPNSRESDPPGPSDPIVVTLQGAPDGGSLISVNKSPVSSLEGLAVRLRDVLQTRADKTIFVKAEGAVPYGRVVEAMDVARGAGVERMGIMPDHELTP